MARAQATDFFHVFKFKVRVVTGGVTGGSDIDGGFTTAVMPEESVEAVEYKEGTFLYTRKFPGNPTFSDLTLTRGVVKARTAFWDWINAMVEGSEYRVDLQIGHFHRDDVGANTDFTNVPPSRIINCFDCVPIRVKPGADFDAQAGEVSIEEIDIAIERFTLEDNNTAA